ncbi:MAG: hypothetical protein ACRDDZ_06710 [Marinifilaceae bacterium]
MKELLINYTTLLPMIKKLFTTFLLLWGYVFIGYSQIDTTRQHIQNQLVGYPSRFPQEKVYLHTDRDHYEAGDSIWFRAFLVNAHTHKESDMSRFVYTELRTAEDSLITRIKLAWRDSVFAGYIPLDKSLRQGGYTLRAFSWWMQNTGDDFIFRKKIHVVNAHDSKVQVKSAYDNEGNLVVTFTSFSKEPYTKLNLSYDNGKRKRYVRTDQDGQIKIPIESSDKGKQFKYVFDSTAPFDYEGYLHIPEDEDEFHVDFFPEGGALLAGCTQTVAFKVLGKDGLSREVSGYIENNRGEFLMPMSTICKGMGAIELTPQLGETYKAKVKLENGVEKEFILPEPVTNQLALKVMVSSRNIGYKVLSSGTLDSSKEYYVLAHMRGVPLFCNKMSMSNIAAMGVNELPEGVLHFVLLDHLGQVYSERMCFVRHTPKNVLDVSTNGKPRRRGNVNLLLGLIQDEKISGSFSVAVTDASKCERDTLAGNILTNLLLTSELRGYIEDPAYYFQSVSPSNIIKLDLLMRTQGWRRFNVSEVVKGNYPAMPFYLERGQSVEGRVNNLRGQNAAAAGLTLLSTNGIIRLTKADKEGRFIIDDVTFPENTHFVIQGQNQKGRRNVEVTVESEPYLSSEFRFPYGGEIKKKEDNFFARFQKDYYYDNGIKVRILDEALVKSRRITKRTTIEETLADYMLDSARMANFEPADMTFLLQEFPGVTFYDDEVQCFNKKILVALDGFVTDDMGMVRNLNPKHLKSISLIKPPKAQIFWGNGAENGVLVIQTNPFYRPGERKPLNINTFVPLGYQRKAECYMPHYEIDSVRRALQHVADMRTTIYWNPNVKIKGTDSATCFFNASDNPGPYRVVIEGVLSNGKVVRREKMIE